MILESCKNSLADAASPFSGALPLSLSPLSVGLSGQWRKRRRRRRREDGGIKEKENEKGGEKEAEEAAGLFFSPPVSLPGSVVG